MAAASLYPQLEPILTGVSKPIQYVGGEVNSVVKDWDAVPVHWALIYPDAYEVGAPNQGVQILYEVLNERDDSLAERAYAVWPDLEAELRAAGLPSFTVDSHRSLAAFDLLGVSLATELGYTNLLTLLDLAGIPLRSAERGEEHPVVVVGGHAAFNPEPISPFVDAAVLGDGEQAVGRISDLVAVWKAARAPRWPRKDCWSLWRAPGPSTCPRSMTSPTKPTGQSLPSHRTARGCRGASASTP